MYDRGFDKPPELPQISEFEEVQQATRKGHRHFSGYRHVEKLPAQYDVDGVLLPRPFKIVRLGPVYLFTRIWKLLNFYRDTLGFTSTEEIIWHGERCLFLRCNTEHHSVALLPLPVRDALGLSAHSKCAAFGIQLANYRQLKEAVEFFRDNGVKVTESIPAELSPRHRILRHGARSRWPHDSALLRNGADRLGGQAEPEGTNEKRRALEDWPESHRRRRRCCISGETVFGPVGMTRD